MKVLEANKVYLVLLSNGSEMFHCWKCGGDPWEVLGCHRTLPPSPECPTDALIKVAMMIMMMIVIILIMLVMKKMMMTLLMLMMIARRLPRAERSDRNGFDFDDKINISIRWKFVVMTASYPCHALM